MAFIAFQTVSAQTDRDAAVAAAGEKYTISAKAGGVNYVEGPVSVLRGDGRSGYLTRRDQIEVGDVVSTGPDARAEILLNPGSFLRIGPNSSFDFKTTSLDDLRIGLKSGSAIFEVFASRDFKIRIVTPKARLLLIKSGVFRIDVTPDGGANVEVWQGEALLGDRNATLLTNGFSAGMVNGGVATVQKFNRKNRDEFETWSQARGKELAKQTAKLRDKALRNSLLSSFNSGRWGMYGSFGLWVYNAMFGGYCFLPFGNGWSSPYGFGYGNCICHFDMPLIIYTPPHGGGGGGGAINPPVTAILSMGDRSPIPPFVRMEGSGGVRGISDSGGNYSPSSGGNYSPSNDRYRPSGSTDRTPTYTPPPPPPVSTDRAPASTNKHNQ